MDIAYFLKKYWYIPLLGLYLVSAYQKYKSEGILTFANPAGISLLTAIILIIYNNIRIIKRFFRRIKYFMGLGTFKWKTEAKFLYRSILRSKDFEQDIKMIIKETLNSNGIKASLSEIELSKDNLNRPKVFIAPISLYATVDFTDSESSDNEGFALEWMSITFRTTLRYKAIRKTINNFLIDLFKELEKRYKVEDVKYVMMVDVEGRSSNFFIEQFIKDVDQKEVSKFSVTMKSTRSTQTITDKGINIVTNRTEELMVAVDNLILRIN